MGIATNYTHRTSHKLTLPTRDRFIMTYKEYKDKLILGVLPTHQQLRKIPSYKLIPGIIWVEFLQMIAWIIESVAYWMIDKVHGLCGTCRDVYYYAGGDYELDLKIIAKQAKTGENLE